MGDSTVSSIGLMLFDAGCMTAPRACAVAATNAEATGEAVWLSMSCHVDGILHLNFRDLVNKGSMKDHSTDQQ